MVDFVGDEDEGAVVGLVRKEGGILDDKVRRQLGILVPGFTGVDAPPEGLLEFDDTVLDVGDVSETGVEGLVVEGLSGEATPFGIGIGGSAPVPPPGADGRGRPDVGVRFNEG